MLRGVALSAAPDWMQYDPRFDALVAAGVRYPELRAWAIERNIAESAGDVSTAFDAPLLDPRAPRDAQLEAVS